MHRGIVLYMCVQKTAMGQVPQLWERPALPGASRRNMEMLALPHPATQRSLATHRSVHELSMMKRAMGGTECFAATSPAVMLARAAAGATQPASGKQQQQQALNYYGSFPLLGEAIPCRAGMDACGQAGHPDDDEPGPCRYEVDRCMPA